MNNMNNSNNIKNSYHYIWSAIHILGRTFNPEDEFAKEAFECLFRCLADLLPDVFYRKNLSNFINQFPVKTYSQDAAFEWTYKLHVYINLLKKKQGQIVTNELSFEKVQQLYNIKNINKHVWGSVVWFLIHFIAANLKTINIEVITSFKAFMMCLRYTVPCPECRQHMFEFLCKVDIVDYLKNNQIFEWTVLFHNEVNQRLNKPRMEAKNIINVYKLKDNTQYEFY